MSQEIQLPRMRALRDVSDLPDVAFGNRSTAWWGTLWLMVIEGMTLVVCATAYLYLRKNFFDFPPRGSALPSLGVPITQLIVMAGSVAVMWYAARAAKRLDLQTARVALLVELVFKAAILVLRWYEFKALNVWWNSNAYGSAAWIVLGFHATLLLLDACEDAGLAIILWSGSARKRHLSDITDDAMYWYFTVVAWIPLFVMVFLYPRWV